MLFSYLWGEGWCTLAWAVAAAAAAAVLLHSVCGRHSVVVVLLVCVCCGSEEGLYLVSHTSGSAAAPQQLCACSVVLASGSPCCRRALCVRFCVPLFACVRVLSRLVCVVCIGHSAAACVAASFACSGGSSRIRRAFQDVVVVVAAAYGDDQSSSVRCVAAAALCLFAVHVPRPLMCMSRCWPIRGLGSSESMQRGLCVFVQAWHCVTPCHAVLRRTAML